MNFPEAECISILKKYQKSQNKIEVIYGGSILKNRGYEQLIIALSYLNKENNLPDYTIRIIGDGFYLLTIKRIARK
ncbi:MAG: hypothetical protein ACTSPW_10345 [Promethearchaeota archaeon]